MNIISDDKEERLTRITEENTELQSRVNELEEELEKLAGPRKWLTRFKVMIPKLNPFPPSMFAP